ncbi:hypothetical protein EYC58_04750 [Candidatus Saccharibacteria bacterium]|nr:MAG: hypothetical protein EYC58_04750 [Candidatus Saccharibacteria bacterium]
MSCLACSRPVAGVTSDIGVQVENLGGLAGREGATDTSSITWRFSSKMLLLQIGAQRRPVDKLASFRRERRHQMSWRRASLLDDTSNQNTSRFILATPNGRIELPADVVYTPVGPAFSASHFSRPFQASEGASSHIFNKKSEPVLGSY